MKKLLWLASWYPNETDPFSGDFIKRQAEAVSLYQPLKIIYAGKCPPGYLPGKTNKLNTGKEFANLEEYILYYPSSGSKSGIISKFRSLYSYFSRHLKIIKQLRSSDELPDLVHVHVAMKAGLIALYLKWKFKIPYVLTEHWSGYYPQSEDSLFKKSFLDRFLTLKVLKYAARFLPVSAALGQQINQRWIQIPFQHIPNVVNTRFFFPAENRPGNAFRFIHISTLVYPKNPEGIVRSFTELLNHGYQAELVLVGPLNPSLHEFIKSGESARDKIICTGEITYEQVGMELRKSSALIIFSFYENMPCVILESLCSGLPVISTRVGGIPEVIQENNGILINTGDENELLEAMKTMMRNYSLYDREEISRKAAGQFSYETIGQKIIRVYDSVLNEK